VNSPHHKNKKKVATQAAAAYNTGLNLYIKFFFLLGET
jgi:hypothetical protein